MNFQEAGKLYGFVPKMRRYNIFHKFIWYLVYGYYEANLLEEDNQLIHVSLTRIVTFYFIRLNNSLLLLDFGGGGVEGQKLTIMSYNSKTSTRALADYQTNTKQNDKSTAAEHFSIAYYLFSFTTQPIHDYIEK